MSLDLNFDNYPDFTSQGEPPCVHYPPDMFFADLEGEPAINSTYMVNEAKKICYICPYQLECLTYGAEENLLGVWGGTSHRQRRSMMENGKVFIPELKVRTKKNRKAA